MKCLKVQSPTGLFLHNFYWHLTVFFGGDVSLSKDTITELYKNLSLETLSGNQNIELEKVSDLTAHINFKMKHSILSNINDQGRATKKSNENIKITYEFFKKPSDEEEFEGQIIEDILEPYEHKKIENPYVPPTPQDAQTIENETKTTSEFNNVDATATKQKRDDYYDKLFDDITDEGDRRQIIDDVVKTEDIFVDDNYLFDNDDTQETKTICDYVLDDIDRNNVLFEHVPVDDTPNYLSLPDPLPSFSDFLLPKNKSKKKAAKIFFKKYQKMRQNREKVKKAAKISIQKLKNARYIKTDHNK